MSSSPLQKHAGKVIVLVVAVLTLLSDSVDRKGSRRMEVNEEMKIPKENQEKMEIPKILHISLLGENPPEYMAKTIEFTSKRASDWNYDVMVWNDTGAHTLMMNYGSDSVKQSWKRLYNAKMSNVSNAAKRADFLRVFVLSLYGGVYLDADLIPCTEGALDFFTNKPGVVSIPFMNSGLNGQVNGCAMSAPQNHKLMKVALDHFVSLGEQITKLNNLDAAGPTAFARAVNNYFDEVGMIDFPKIERGRLFFDTDKLNKTGIWSEVADLRFARRRQGGLHHLGFGSWNDNKEKEKSCVTNPSLVEPWLKAVCAGNTTSTMFWSCGEV